MAASKEPSKWHPSVQRIYRGGVKVLALSSVAAAAMLYFDYKAAKEVDKESPEQKKKSILVLPFHRMKLVEQKGKFNLGQQLSAADGDDDSKVIEVEVKELVNMIHAAAQDPNIVALYGKFGHGFGFSAGGWAQVEEVRNALRVFKESHRVHWEPNRSHKPLPSRRGNAPPKRMFGYADSFTNPMDPANKEYYLASIFKKLHLQTQGEINLFGNATSYPFLRGALDKYGVKVHVFKHGMYKNAPNMFTEKHFVPPHLENTKSIVQSLNDQVCSGITHSRRSLASSDGLLWNMLHRYGSIPAQRSVTLGLVDYVTRMDPLQSLVDANKSEEAKKAAKEKWGTETEVDKFEAVEAVPMSKYAAIVKKRKSLEERSLRHYARLRNLAEKYIYVEAILAGLGYPWPYYNIKEEDYVKGMSKATKEKIALIHVEGTINDEVACKTVSALRKIKKDDEVKCVVLRVDSRGGSSTASETILQELKDIPQPSLCSMGNYAASGGYYIASNCNRIYALPTTLTGSIGVFGLKMDLTGMAKQYGVKVQHVVTGPLSASNNPFQPLTKPIKENFSRSVDRVYDFFKKHVSVGRNMSMEDVEYVAQGRVFTGDQAREAGLVDELGDLTRVIGYANRNYTSGYAQVEVWPKPQSFRDKLKKLLGAGSDDNDEKPSSVLQVFKEIAAGAFRLEAEKPVHVNETDMTRQLLTGWLGSGVFNGSPIPSSLSGIMLTTNENDAMKCMLQEHSRTYARRMA